MIRLLWGYQVQGGWEFAKEVRSVHGGTFSVQRKVQITQLLGLKVQKMDGIVVGRENYFIIVRGLKEL